MTVFAVAVSVLVVAAAWAFTTLRRHRARPVLVELKDGRTVEGLHTSHSPRWVTLTAASTFDAEGTPVSIDGNVHIPRAHVAWIIDGHKP